MLPLTPIHSSRLTLRSFSLADAPRVRELAGDFAIADTTLAMPHPYPPGAAEEWIARHEPEAAAGTARRFAITRSEDGLLVGAIGLEKIDPGHQGELGYWIGKPYWGQGYCTEAAAAVLRYAFETAGLQRVFATHFTRNPASGAVMRKVGMRHEGQLRSHVRKGQALEDVEHYGILAQDWRSLRDSEAVASDGSVRQPASVSVEHLALRVRDLEQMRGFYETHFACLASARYHNPKKGFSSCFLRFAQGARLELIHDTEQPGDSLSLARGYAHLALSVGSEAAVREKTQELVSAGCVLHGNPRWTGDGYYESVVADPEGNLIEITL